MAGWRRGKTCAATTHASEMSVAVGTPQPWAISAYVTGRRELLPAAAVVAATAAS